MRVQPAVRLFLVTIIAAPVLSLSAPSGSKPPKRAAAPAKPAAIPAPAAPAIDLSGLIPEDRRVPWSPGIPGGIPEVKKICARISAEKYGDGTVDAAPAIQAALDACPEGQAVLLPAGTYRTGMVLWIRKGIVLRGEGPAKTRILRHEAQDNWHGAVIRIINDAYFQKPVAITARAPLGARRIEVADAAQFQPGDILQVDQRDDPALVTTGDCKWMKRTDPDGGARSMGQRVEVAGKEGAALLLATPLYLALDPALHAEAVKLSPAPVRGAGIEDLYVTGGIQTSIDVVNAAYSWVKNVESDKVLGRHMSIMGCYRCVVRDSFVHHARDYQSGAHAYGISLNSQTTDTLVENNVAYYLNKPIILEAAGGGNVVAYNYADDPILGQQPTWQEMAIDGTHCSHPFMTLFEGNWAPHIGASNTHGSASNLTFFRNHASTQARTVNHTSNTNAIQLDAGMLGMNVLGNVLGRPGAGTRYGAEPDPKKKDVYLASTVGWPPPKIYMLGGWARDWAPQNFDPRVEATLLRHGNFDYASNQVQWDPKIARKDLPPSLYLAAKPAFFGDLPWPFVDPLRQPMVGTLPAKARFDAMKR
jgi:hypothetical protein